MDADKIKDFIVHNFEKAIVMGVLVLSGLLIWSGVGKPVVTNQFDPEDQETQARLVKGEIDEDHNETVVVPREPTFDIAQELQKARRPIPASIYVPESPWDISTMSADKVARKDPALSKPVGLEVNGVIASLAYRSVDGLYPLQELDPAGALEVVEKRPTRSRRRNRRSMDDGMGDMMGDMGGDMGGMMGDMGGDQSGGYDAGDFGDMMGGGMMGGGTTSTTETVRKLDPKDNLGFKPSTTIDLKTKAEQEPVPGVGWFIAGTAAIPHKELIDAYQEAFSNAAGYLPDRRDRPIYIAYQVERADVTDKSVAELEEDDWILRDDRERTLRNAVLYWSGVADEVIPSDYWIGGVTMWIPPVMLDSATDFATNALIPLKTKKELDLEKQRREAEEQSKNAAPMSGDDIEFNLSGTGNSGGMGGMDGYGGSGMDGYGDMGDMGGMMGDMGGMMGDMGGMMGDMGGGMGYGGSAGMAGKPAESNPVDYKLLRFYDFAYLRGAPRDRNAPRPNRKYVYRVRFAVNDPNFPEDPKLQPKGRDLDSEAYERFIANTAKSRETQKRDFKRWSDWSEVSAPVALPSLDRSVVGPVKAERAKRISAGNRSIVVESEAPKAEVVAGSFDIQLGVFVPTRMTVTEGTVLSESVEKADVVDPITLEIKEAKDKVVKSASTIIDIEGGIPLEIVEEEEMTEPGLFLMIDSQGRLRVRDSVEEQQVYRIRSYAEGRGL